MGEIVNLRRARKDRKRETAAKEGEANRLAFGRTKHERTLTGQENTRAARLLAGHMREPGTSEKPASSDD
ncbi:MAG: hypothetical protein JWM36_2959 [Hyphomicrobiales bacterium]|nr:hypothetical protein [Hyphomicrobiales bacterium]